MRGRAKRARRYSPGVVDSPSGSLSFPAENGMGSSMFSGFEVDTSQFECGSFASKCSVRLIHEVVSKFDMQKRKLVKDTGFIGILSFPPFKQFHRKFALWLMTCVDESSSTLNIGQHIRIRFTSNDVGNVLGLPCSGLAVCNEYVSSREAKGNVLHNFLGEEFKEHRSIKYVQEILERDYSCPMCKDDADRWKVAFVVFVASNLLCPSAKHDYASIDYWNAIQDPDKIPQYDWAEYVRVRLIESVSKLKQDLCSNIKFPNITGCSVFLQVFYLDSLDLGELATLHNSSPRVSDFPSDKLRAMINADRNFYRYINGEQDTPIVKLRNPSGCIYSWALGSLDPHTDPRTACLLSLWESAIAMVQLLNIPLEAAGPVFVAAADFQEQINSGLTVTGIQAIKFMTVLVSIMIPYRRGFSYVPSDLNSNGDISAEDLSGAIARGTSLLSFPLTFNRRITRLMAEHSSLVGDTHMFAGSNRSTPGVNEASSSNAVQPSLHSSLCGDPVQQSVRSVFATLDEMPHHLNVNLRVASAMSQFYSLLRTLKSPLGFDLNAAVHCSSHDNILTSVSATQPHQVVPSPWELGYIWPNACSESVCGLDKLSSIFNDGRFLIIHRIPREIKVSALSLSSQLLRKRELESDLFDALIRTLRQEDDRLYASFGHERWRHCFESDFMESVLSGSVDTSTSNIRNVVSDSMALCDLSKCHHLFFLALLHCRWVCFVWSLERNVLSIFEPSFRTPVPEERLQVIQRSSFLLKIVLQMIGQSFLSLSNIDAAAAEMRIITLAAAPPSWLNRSGVLCSLFCRCFDGTDLTPKFQTVDIDQVASSLLYELSTLKDNYGIFPSELG